MKMSSKDIPALLKRIAQKDRRAVAQLMSLVESNLDYQGRHKIYERTGQAHIVGLTGVPGSGKSTMLKSLTHIFRDRGNRVGIVAIDPSSPFSGGAILGDRLRMTDMAQDDGIFIRSMATRGALGGLALATMDIVDILDIAGFDKIMIETVGVGQDEVDIARAAHTVVVVSAPGLGDDIQAIKAGILEIADIHVVSKCDRDDALQTLGDLESLVKLTRFQKAEDSTWEKPVLPTSCQNRTGILELADSINAHHDYLHTSGEIDNRRRHMLEMRVLKVAEKLIWEKITTAQDKAINTLMEDMMAHRLSPHEAAETILQTL